MEETQRVDMEFGSFGKLTTKHEYTVEQARELQEIAVRAAEVALMSGSPLVPQPVTRNNER